MVSTGQAHTKKDIMSDIYDPIIIDYDDNYEFVTKADDVEEVPKNKKINNYISYDDFKPLLEVEVDPGWEKETLSPKEEFYLSHLRTRFGVRGKEPIPYSDLASAFYSIANKNKKRVGRFQISTMLRHMWRHGDIRRYVKGRVQWTVKKGRGETYGVHYSLYPKKEE